MLKFNKKNSYYFYLFIISCEPFIDKRCYKRAIRHTLPIAIEFVDDSVWWFVIGVA